MLYVISKIYAIFWMVKKFEYELGGKKFKIETDHKVLVKFRNKQALKIIEITDGLKKCRVWFHYWIKKIGRDDNSGCVK